MPTVNQICDYIILMCRSGGEQLNVLKLQKLLYYVQAWNLAFEGKPLFEGKFQAWIHGPVNREIYDRFSPLKTLYTAIVEADLTPEFNPESIPQEVRDHINNVLEVYAPFSGSELESQAHNEEPWIEARKGYRPTQRCDKELDEALIAAYYKKRIK